MEKREIFPLIILAAILITAFVFNEKAVLDENGRMATHWDAKGEVNGYGGRFTGVWLLPLVAVGMYLLFLLIPKIEVYQKNFMSFYKEYMLFCSVMLLFMLSVYAATILYNLGYHFNMTFFMLPAIGVLFFVIGHVLKHARRNFFVGIRTPWTLSSDAVWKKTHEAGAVVFRIIGVMFILAVFLSPSYGLWIVLGSVLACSLGLVIYSYVLFAKEKKGIRIS